MRAALLDNTPTYDIPPSPVSDPAGWLGPDIQNSDRWQYRLSSSDLADIDAALKSVRNKGLSIIEIGKDDFPLGAFGETLQRLRHDLLEGLGLFKLSGVPVGGRYSMEDSAILYWGIGAHLGFPVSQNGRGHLLGHVIDLGRSSESEGLKKYRGYSSREELAYHQDSADLVGLFCLAQAKSGGESVLVSSVAIHNEIHRTRPDLLKVLYQPFWVSRKSEIPAGAKPYFRIPIFNYFQGRLTAYFSGGHMMALKVFPELPPFTEEQQEGIALINKLANDPRFHMRMTLQPGDIQFLHNHTMLHTRTAYEDYPEIDRRRHLLRLWTIVPENRPLPQWIYDCTGGGRRGGICIPGVKEVASLDP